MGELLHDLRYALRGLLKAPGLTLLALLTLMLGIGGTTAVFSIVRGVLLQSLPFPQARRLVDIKQIPVRYLHPGASGGTSPSASYRTWRTATDVFEGMAAYTGADAVLTKLGPAQRVMVWHVSATFLPLLGGRPLLGRGFAPDEDRPGSPPLAILSHRFWISRLGGDPRALGEVITLDTIPYTVVGIMPSDFRYPADAAVWTNLGAALSGPAGAHLVHQWGFWVVGRLRPGVSVARAQATLDRVSREAWASEPDMDGSVPVVRSLQGFLVSDVRTPLWIMFGATLLVLLVACANVSSLLLARASDREREMAVRAALGAGGWRIARQVLSESVVLGLGGGMLGVLASRWSVPALLRLAGSEVPKIQSIGVDVWVLVAAVGLSIVTGLVAGSVPALRAAFRSPGDVLKGASGGSTPPWRNRPASLLVATQAALTLVLLASAGLLLRSFDQLVHADPGFDPTQVVVAELHLPPYRYATSAARQAYVERALEQARSLPGVSTVAAASGIPFAGGAISSVAVPGLPSRPDQPWAWVSAVTADYFRTLRIPVLRGRLPRTAAEAAIDPMAARTYFSGQDPLGRAISVAGSHRLTVVGIVRDTRQETLADPPPPHVYPALLPNPGTYLKVLVRSESDPNRVAMAIRRALQTVDNDVPLDNVAPMTVLMSDSLAQQRLYTWLLGIFAAMALALAATGLYGLASYSVMRRTREIGIRIALGADRGRVVGLVVRDGLILTAAGVVVGLAATIGVTRVLRRFLFQVTPTDPLVLSTVVVGLLLVAVVAAFVPARRATRVDPILALRAE